MEGFFFREDRKGRSRFSALKWELPADKTEESVFMELSPCDLAWADNMIRCRLSFVICVEHKRCSVYIMFHLSFTSDYNPPEEKEMRHF